MAYRILDDGWVWHPVGIPATWSLERWSAGNVWESEDGPTRKILCTRDYYWDHAAAWIDETRVALGGIGEDDLDMIDGARIFDVALPEDSNVRTVREINAFQGRPASSLAMGPGFSPRMPLGFPAGIRTTGREPGTFKVSSRPITTGAPARSCS